MPLARVTSLDGEAILPLADAKASARILSTAEDDLLSGFRNAAIATIEARTEWAFAESQWRWTERAFPARIELPMRPVVSVQSVTYHDADGAEQAYTGFRLVGGEVLPAVNGAWPFAHGYAAVAFTAGPAPSDKLAVMLTAAKIEFQIINDRGRSGADYVEGMRKAQDMVLAPLLACRL